MTTTAAGISTATVSTDQLAPLGFELVVPAASGADSDAGNGPQTWIYVYNDEASTAFAVGQCIYRDPSATTQDWYGGLITPVTVHQPKVMVLGFAQHTIAAGSYGFILKQGVGFVKCGSATVGPDLPFTTGGDDTGCVLTYADDASSLSANIGVIGFAATILVADAATVNAYVNCG
tara:strand:- start:17383 stop:17910 length:528 start_codon:yes stop_codon:yes gene_type:complete